MSRGAPARFAMIGALTFATITIGDTRAAAEATAPQTVPTLRNWAPAGGGFALGARARVFYTDDSLLDMATDFAAGLRVVTGKDVVPQAGSAAAAGDIVLRVAGVPEAPNTPEAYRLSVGDTLDLQGAGEPGAFYATRSALQLLRRGGTIPGGTATDWPDYAERGLMLDVGRQFMPVEMVRAQIRRMGMLKLNMLHLHLSDSFGFRLESARHPEITASDHYSKQDIRDLVAYAARYQVEVVPEVDFPGHMNGILAAHPALKLRSANGDVSDAAIDISDPRSYDLMRDILEEFLPLFPGRYWHLGADEFLLDGFAVRGYADYPQLGAYARATYGPQAEPVDAFLGLINWGAAIVREHGKRPRIWNDGLHTGEGTIAIGSDIVVDYWSRAGYPGLPLPFFGIARTPQDLIATGHQVRNAAFLPTYYVTGGPAAAIADQPPVLGYELWDPAIFVDGSRLTPAQNAANLGASLHVWCDDPAAQTPDQIAASITMPLRIMAQKTWGPAHPAAYSDFTALSDAVAEPA
ncbi:beta-N-acetylhexosaminidase [Nocardia goodfellowii]|uniref:Hexosaminidase n=1 Tax=Nocardia goodfellowii TaxID=882446 RepID=A0ABS4QD02_9NOCA|nr:beta-N-acetylhexosaminidase [Nocardia goodfellowii]MBP2188993.1 hexosaminidase [Nocardia goodfellowii]